MLVDIRRVTYTYNSSLESAGEPAFFLDALVLRDGTTLIDRHSAFKSREELYQAMEELVPLLEDLT